MRLAVSRVPAGGLRKSVREEVRVEGVEPRGPLDLAVHVRRVGRRVLVEGRLSGVVALECARCLEPFVHEVGADFVAEFAPKPQPGETELALDGAEMDVAFFDGDVLDLGDLVREQLLLALPLRRVCREDCPGLCPVCGTKRNRDGCTCRDDEVDPRFRILAKLKGEADGQSDE